MAAEVLATAPPRLRGAPRDRPALGPHLRRAARRATARAGRHLGMRLRRRGGARSRSRGARREPGLRGRAGRDDDARSPASSGMFCRARRCTASSNGMRPTDLRRTTRSCRARSTFAQRRPRPQGLSLSAAGRRAVPVPDHQPRQRHRQGHARTSAGPAPPPLLMSWGIASFLPHRRGYGNSPGPAWREEVTRRVRHATNTTRSSSRRLDRESDDVLAALACRRRAAGDATAIMSASWARPSAASTRCLRQPKSRALHLRRRLRRRRHELGPHAAPCAD